MMASAACAALMMISLPVQAQTLPVAATYQASDAVSAFYGSRSGAPLWFKSGADSSAARELIGILQRSALDGMPSGPAVAEQAQALLGPAQSGDPAALAAADQILSVALVNCGEALQIPLAGMTYAG